MSILPFYLIKGKRRIDAENDAIHHQLQVVRDRIKVIEQQQNAEAPTLNTHDYRTLENLNDEERFVTICF